MNDFKKTVKEAAKRVGDFFSDEEKFDPNYHDRTNSILRTKEILRTQRIEEQKRQAKENIKKEGPKL